MTMKGVAVIMVWFFFEIDRTLHFSGWKLIFQRCSHSANLIKSSCNLTLSISDVIVRYIIVLSSNSLVFYVSSRYDYIYIRWKIIVTFVIIKKCGNRKISLISILTLTLTLRVSLTTLYLEFTLWYFTYRLDKAKLEMANISWEK